MPLVDANPKMNTFEVSTGSLSMLAEYPEIVFESLTIDPEEPTVAKPGSEEKVCMLAARYAAGLPLWHNGDCVDHGPEGEEVEED